MHDISVYRSNYTHHVDQDASVTFFVIRITMETFLSRRLCDNPHRDLPDTVVELLLVLRELLAVKRVGLEVGLQHRRSSRRRGPATQISIKYAHKLTLNTLHIGQFHVIKITLFLIFTLRTFICIKQGQERARVLVETKYMMEGHFPGPGGRGSHGADVESRVLHYLCRRKCPP